ncbi:MAG: fumarate hydratase, class [Pseudomonadota bacterium]|jgi:fumarate hydratase class II|nr:class II fumarate hydratase [Burkholderiales bacterium]
MASYRIESDSLGEIKVSTTKYWGAQTQRSLKYFAIGQELMPLQVIHALALIKKAAATTNNKLKILPKRLADLIIMAANEVISGQLNQHFPLHVWMTGSGTQSNMNVNEVIANRAIELAQQKIGSKNPVHPNDHVNLSQSSNDVFPSAMNIATVIEINTHLLPILQTLSETLWCKAKKWQKIIKIGRTHLQDAVPLTLGQEFSGYAVLIEDNIARIKNSLIQVKHLAIGGTAVGTGLNAPANFSELIIKEINKLTGETFISAENKFAVQGSHDALVNLSGVLKTTANSLFKIANDIRFLSCGPRAGINELILPENEPGSSIMPGKVNPTQCEALSMVAIQVMANDLAVTLGGSSGSLEMNAFKPLMIYNILQSITLLTDAVNSFTQYLLKGLQPNKKRIETLLNNSLMLITAISTVIGYDKAAQIAHYAHIHDCSLSEANLQLKFLPAKEFEKLIKPSKMLNS